MKGFAFAVLIALLLATSAGAQFNPQPLYEYAATYTYWSDVSDGVYNWAVRNESTTVTLIGWTTGQNYPIGTIPGAAIVPEATFPLPTVQPTLARPWFNAFYWSASEPLTVISILRWSDGSYAAVPVWMATDAPMASLVVPEPSGLMGLSVGIGGLIAWMRRSRYTGRN